MKRMFLSLMLSALAATPASAAHWNVDMAKSKLGFTLPWGKQPFVASFGKWQADIDFDPDNLAQSHVTTLITLSSENSGDDDTDQALKSDQGFSIGKFPSAKFESRSFQHLSGNNYAAEGTLTIRGISRPVHMPFVLTTDGTNAHMVGDVQIKWADFGLGQEMGNEMPDLGKVVTIHADLTARKG
jgi:polyisoprenoid-binding protein YceI